MAYSFALKSKQTSVAKVDKLCAKLAFKNMYASGMLEDPNLYGNVSFNVCISGLVEENYF